MQTGIRVALAQINATVGDLEGNRMKIAHYIAAAKKQKVDIISFPELALCGYPPEDLLHKEHFVEDSIDVLSAIARKTTGIIAVVGCLDRDRRKNVYNAAAVIAAGSVKGMYRKIELPNYGVFDEKRYFARGSENRIFRTETFCFGINICEDIWIPDGPHKAQADAGAELLINISSSPYYAGKVQQREKMLRGRAKSDRAFVLYNNLVGGQDELVFDGSSCIFDPKGTVIASGKQFEEDLIMADLFIQKKQRRKEGSSRSCPVRMITVSYTPKDDKKTKIPPQVAERLDPPAELYNALVRGTRDYVDKNGFEKVVLGLSGGIDSALTAAIACDAIGKKNVIGVTMPSRYSSQATQSDAKTVAENLGMPLISIPIGKIFDAYLVALKTQFEQTRPDITEENLQARIRGNILMALSNKFGWLVLTTGNKSETSVGYCTLYGDMAGGFAVIKDVPKTLVYKLSQFRNKREKRRAIPESVITREPSAELKENQRDRDTLPPYPVLDAILKEYIEEDKSLKKISAEKFDPLVVKRVISMVDRNEYKRRQSPPGIKITPKAFGRDRRLPITNRYRGF